MKNMVDERFECAAVIFRLAGRQEYCALDTDYQREVAEAFAKFAGHEAVEYVKNSDFNGYHDVPQFAVHIEKKDNKFVFIEEIKFPFNNWSEAEVKNFLVLFNKFYIDADYAEFYNSYLKLFEEATRKFVDECYGRIDFEWFGKYIELSKLRCIYSLSSGNYMANVNDEFVYSVVWQDGGAIVHEFCHQFANLIAEKWYSENAEFKKWCDDSVDEEKMPYYSSGIYMAYEYVTRAYNLLYLCQSNGMIFENGLHYKTNITAPFLVLSDVKNGFPYIGEVYGMVLKLENK